MKTVKFLVCLTLITVISANLYAQQTTGQKNEIKLGYGFITGTEFGMATSDIFGTLFIHMIGLDIKSTSVSAYGIPTIEYNRVIKPWLNVGGTMGINPIFTRFELKSGTEVSYDLYCIPVMAQIKFKYIHQEMVNLYSALEGGACIQFWQDNSGSKTISDGCVTGAFHATVLGISVGKTIGGFMDWGFGYRGLVNFGIVARF